jgi:hypothetical protein
MIIEQIELSLRQPALYFISLMTALAIPDIAGALDSPDGRATGASYESWYEKWVRHQFIKVRAAHLPRDIADLLTAEDPNTLGLLTGQACYSFRCSLLHQGRMNLRRDDGYSRILFILPRGPIRGHNNVVNGALNIDVIQFCEEVIAGTREWLDQVETTSLYQKNYNEFAHLYPNGTPGLMPGVPIVT